MKREPANLVDTHFDVLVIGAGIHGACIAREAVLRGLSVALIDRDDFGSATSANSMKVIHGGLRYLQSLDLRRMRESARERRTLMRLAGHLVHPQPFVVPTRGWGKMSRLAMRTALGLADRLAPDETEGVDAAHQLPRGRVISRREVVDLFPALAHCDDLTGGALWHDALAHNTERLTLAFVRDAVERGAIAVNYVDAQKLVLRDGRVVGASVHDRIGGGKFEVLADMVVNVAGPWLDRITNSVETLSHREPLLLAKAWNVVTRQLHPTHAIGVLPRRGRAGTRRDRRMLFITPWHGRSIVGTMYAPADADTDTRVTDQEVERLIDAVNSAYPGGGLRVEDVTFRHGGLLPVHTRDARGGNDTLADRSTIIDHLRDNRVGGILTVCGVKYTTARLVAVRVTDKLCERLGRGGERFDSSYTPIDGGDFERFDAFEIDLRQQAPPELVPHVERLARHYGTRAHELIGDCVQRPSDAASICESTSVTHAEVRYGVGEEMAVKLADIVMRRTDLGTAGYPGHEALRNCAAIIAEDLGWSSERTRAEISEVAALFGADTITSERAAGYPGVPGCGAPA